MKCVRLHPYPKHDRPGPLLPIGPFPFLVLEDVVIVAAVRNTEVLKDVVTKEGVDLFHMAGVYQLERKLTGAGTCLPDGRVIDWYDDLRKIATPNEIREEVAAALEAELAPRVDTTRPSFLQLLSAFWAAEDDFESQQMRGDIIRAFGRRLAGTASVHELANEVVAAFPAKMPSAQRLAWLKAVIDQMVLDGKLRRVSLAGDPREYGEYDVPYELA